MTVLGRFSDEVGFDCASVSEINLALNSSKGEVRRCIYANPQRAEADLVTALSLGVEALTFDGVEELKKIRMAHDNRLRSWKEEGTGSVSGLAVEATTNSTAPLPPEMILRILVPDTSSSVPLGEKFGAKPTDVAALTEECIDLELPLVGVSFHCGSGCHDPEAFGTAIRLAKEAIDVIDKTKDMRRRKDGVESRVYQKCSLLDIGGGYPGLDGSGGDLARFCGTDFVDSGESCASPKEVESAHKIAAVVTPLVNRLFPSGESNIRVISEPGRYFVESAFALCSRVYCSRSDAKGRRHYYIAQGVQGVFKDVLLCGEKFCPIPLQWDSHGSPEHNGTIEKNTELFPSIVHGPSGNDYDTVCDDCLLPHLKVGDWLVFDRMGAYTLSIAAKSGRLPVRYVMRC